MTDGWDKDNLVKDNIELLVAEALATGKSLEDLVGHPAMQELIKETCSQVIRDEIRGCFNEEDLAQEVSLKVWLYGKDFRRNSYFRTWVRKIARNAYVDLMRKNAKDNTHSLDEEEEVVGGMDRIGSSNESQASRVSLKEAIDQLSDTERELLRLSVVGWKLSDFERRLGIPKSVASRKLRRIQKKLIMSIVGFEIFRTT